MNGSTYISDSKNSKLLGSGKVDATYSAINSTCPTSCSLKDSGCYAQTSFVGIQVVRLNKEASDLSALEVARAEANAIDASYNGGDVPDSRLLRLHVSGDSRTIKGTRLINNAIKRWQARGGGAVWSYTHAWREVPRMEWSAVSMLASVSSVKEVKEARRQGYAPAIVVSEHKSDKTYTLPGSKVKWIPCPNQTNEIGCSDCKLCFNANRLYKDNFGIAFAAHGILKNKIKRRLPVIK
jgi:hypothetical protein